MRLPYDRSFTLAFPGVMQIITAGPVGVRPARIGTSLQPGGYAVTVYPVPGCMAIMTQGSFMWPHNEGRIVRITPDGGRWCVETGCWGDDGSMRVRERGYTEITGRPSGPAIAHMPELVVVDDTVPETGPIIWELPNLDRVPDWISPGEGYGETCSEQLVEVRCHGLCSLWSDLRDVGEIHYMVHTTGGGSRLELHYTHDDPEADPDQQHTYGARISEDGRYWKRESGVILPDGELAVNRRTWQERVDDHPVRVEQAVAGSVL